MISPGRTGVLLFWFVKGLVVWFDNCVRLLFFLLFFTSVGI